MRVIPPLSQAEEAEAKKSQLIGAILFGVANQTSAYVVEHGHAHITTYSEQDFERYHR